MMGQTDERKDFAHAGPGTLAGRYLRRFWHPIEVSGALQIGRPLRVHVLGEFFTLWRGEGGTEGAELAIQRGDLADVICRPTGRWDAVNPHGKDSAGQQASVMA